MAALIQRQFVMLSFLTAFLFMLSGVMALSGHRVMPSSSTIQQATSNISSLALLTLMGQEIPALTEKVQSPPGPASSSLSGYLFQLVTGIRPGDYRTILANELAGMHNYDFQVAETDKAPDYSDLAIEYPALPKTVTGDNTGDLAADKPNTDVAVPTTASPSSSTKQTTKGKEVVFIYNTHNRESWLSETTQEGASVDNKTRNVTLISRRLAEELNAKGIGTGVGSEDIYQNLLDNKKSFPLAYAESLKVVQAAVQKNRELNYFFDIHRDSSPRDETTVTIKGKEYARISFVIGMRNKNHEKNTAFAKQLQKLLEAKYPGITRPVTSKNENTGNGEYNQSVSPGSLLLEFGGIENTPEECFNTAEAFAEVFADYYWQAERVNTPKTAKPDKG